MQRTVTVQEMKEAVTLVYNECNGHLPLTFKVRNTAEEMYDARIIERYPELKRHQGAYLPGDGRVEFICSNILYPSGGERGDREKGEGRGIEAALKIVRHEVLGHYALNTCSAEQKFNILNKIVASHDEPSIAFKWQEIEPFYPNRTPLMLAEEVFAFSAEKKPTLDATFDLSIEPFTIKHVEQIAARIAEGIRLGERSQQIFPATNHAQFSHTNSGQQAGKPHSQYSTDYRWSSADTRMMVTINGLPPSQIDAKTLSAIADKDKFLSCYPLADIQSGKLDVKVAKGVQPVPKVYDRQGELVINAERRQALKLNR